MYECPNCGSNLKFDIASQQMVCSYCGTTADPYSVEKDPGDEENGRYEATVFTCSQCGAALLSEDTTVATFCSFCGSTAVLESRIGKGRRPAYIIPFAKTREDCRASYAKMMRRAIFAPKELKNPEYIEKFRGIYMPYWIYSFEKEGNITFHGSTSRQRGDYLITKHYDIASQVEASYEGISYDAAAAFSDDLSGAIAPFDMDACKSFTPSFLSGFYADAGDVDGQVYEREACELVTEECFNRIAGDRVCSRYQVKDGSNEYVLRNALRPKCTATVSAMLPVWFLSYRKGDRVAYAAVNGQTGMAAADLPVDRKKYLIGSLLLALPLFFLLNLSFTIRPGTAMLLSAFLAFLCAVISYFQMLRIREKETGESDKGYVYAKSRRSVREEDDWTNYAEKGQRSTPAASGSTIKVLQIILGTLVFVLVMPLAMEVVMFRGGGMAAMLAVFVGCMVLMRIVSLDRWRKPMRKGDFKEMLPVLAKPVTAILLAFAILLWNPVSDLYYYGGACLSMAAVIWTLLDIIGRYNILATRKLPQFNRRGGDENV